LSISGHNAGLIAEEVGEWDEEKVYATTDPAEERLKRRGGQRPGGRIVKGDGKDVTVRPAQVPQGIGER